MICVFASAAEAQQVITQYLPHFVAGSLPASDWESKALFVNLSGVPNAVTIDFFDNAGSPLVLSTSKGTNSSFVVNLQKPAPDSIASDVLEILRNSGSFVTGWTKVTSDKPFAVDLEFRQFAPGSTEPTGKADVPSSPVENVLTYPLAPNNGVALVNPGSQDARVSFTAFDRSGNKLKEGAFVLARGAKMSSFFNQAPFFLDSIGIIVIASNISLSGIAMDFEGLVFKTIPRIPTPRRLDSQAGNTKIGFVVLTSNDRQPAKREEVQQYFGEAVYFQKILLDKEMLLNGFNRVELPYDLDSNGLPSVVMVDGGDRKLYVEGNERALTNIENEIRNKIPENWKFVVVVGDVGNPNDLGDDMPIRGGGGWFSGRVYMRITHMRKIHRSFLGNEAQCPGESNGITLSRCVNVNASLFNHEAGHGFWGLDHSAFADDSHGLNAAKMKFRSMVGGGANEGCYNPEKTKKGECVLMSVEAEGIARGSLSNLNDFGWIPEKQSWPKVEIKEKEFDGKRLRVIFKAEDAENGISSVKIETIFDSPWAQYWKQIGHTDDLENFVIEVDLKPQFGKTKIGPVYLVVSNNHGQKTLVNLF
ncbi:MAG: hypothetical protein AAB556_01405 [Patescibacteria group bacterium]